MGDTDEVGQHPAVLDARQRLHAVVGQDRVRVAARRRAAPAPCAGAAAHLERRQHEVAWFERDVVADRNHLRLGLVAQRERRCPGRPRDEERVDLASGDGDRPDQRVGRFEELRLGYVEPLDDAGSCAGQLSHLTIIVLELCSSQPF